MVAVEGPLNEKAIRYYLLPSLKHISSVKIVIKLWKRSYIPYYIENMLEVSHRSQHYSEKRKIFKRERNKILRVALKLSKLHSLGRILKDLVDLIGQEIFDWIEYHDRCVFGPYRRVYSLQGVQSFAVYLLDNLVWTSKGMVDYRETAKLLLTENQLSDLDSCLLACAYCFEEDIAIIMPKVYSRINRFLSLNHSRSFFNQTMAYFWIAKMTGDFTELNERVNVYNGWYKTNYSIYECVLRILSIHSRHRKNQVAIKYILSKLNNEEKSRQIVSLAIYNISDANLMCFFLSQMYDAQQEQVFKARAINVLLSFLDNWLWIDHFLSTINRMWDIISGMDYLGIVTYIVSHRMENHMSNEKYYRYKTILKEIWQSAPNHLKEFVFKFKNGSEVNSILSGLLCERNLQTVPLLLDDTNYEPKKALFLSRSNYQTCYRLIIHDQLNLVKIFIKNNLSSKKNVNMFKSMLVGGYGRDIVVRFIQNGEWGKTEQFLQWAFKSDHDARKFKRKLVCCKICDRILEYMVENNNDDDFVELEHFLNWCASDDEKKVIKLKKKIPHLYFNKVICSLIKENNYQLLEDILNWCFLHDRHQIELFKLNFYHNNEVFVVELLRNLVEKSNQLEHLEKFVSWCFSNEGEISRFKEWILQSGRKEAEAACLLLLYKSEWESTDEFIRWCCDSSRSQISNFKNELMLNSDTEHFFAQCSHYELLNALDWWKPSRETLSKIELTKWYKHFHKLDY